MDKFKTLQYIIKDSSIKCNIACKSIPNSLVCKLKIFNASCPIKSLKEDYQTGCYEIVSKEEL